MKTVHKYKIPDGTRFEIELPGEFKVVLFTEQHGIPHMWIQLDTVDLKINQTFYVLGTGRPLPENRHVEHVGSCINGDYVWHLYVDQGENFEN